MGHIVLSVLVVVLETFALILMSAGLLMAFKRMSGNALIFTAGMACLALLLAVGVHAHMDIAKPFRYAGVTLPLGVLFFVKRVMKHDNQASKTGKTASRTDNGSL